MPHRPDRSGGAPSTVSSSGVSLYSQVNGLSGEAAAHIMRPSSVGYAHHSGVVSQLKPWVSTPGPHALRAMVPPLEKLKSSDSTDRSTATLATEASADELEKREATASALLLVSTAAVRHQEPHQTEERELAESSNEDLSSPAPPSAVPLKKRKKHLDFLRRNQDSETCSDAKLGPCHVSPVSQSSEGLSHVEGRTVSHEEVTPDRRRRLEATSQRSHSYDSKESPFKSEATQELLDSAKIHNATDIALPTQVVIPHFPSVLHQVLSDSEYAGNVVSWLPDGEAWKVLRWDALRRQVLPRYFSDLRDENGSGCGTIDAFLWHLTAWGFEEIKDGTDVGAYKHELFIRGAQKLCSKMRFTDSHGHDGPKTVTPLRLRQGDDRALLQVPTLSTGPRNDVHVVGAVKPNKRPRYEEASPVMPPSSVRRPSPISWMGYRTEEAYPDPSAWGNYYSDPSRMYSPMVHHDPRYIPHHQHHHHHPRAVTTEPLASPAPVYSPPQVRSGRGAMRVAGSCRSPATASPVTTPTSFPVSNRGKGRTRSIVSSPDVKSTRGTSPVSTPVSLDEAQRIGSSVQGVAIAVSRKTKRKLPLQRNAEKDCPDS